MGVCIRPSSCLSTVSGVCLLINAIFHFYQVSHIFPCGCCDFPSLFHPAVPPPALGVFLRFRISHYV